MDRPVIRGSTLITEIVFIGGWSRVASFDIVLGKSFHLAEILISPEIGLVGASLNEAPWTIVEREKERGNGSNVNTTF